MNSTQYNINMIYIYILYIYIYYIYIYTLYIYTYRDCSGYRYITESSRKCTIFVVYLTHLEKGHCSQDYWLRKRMHILLTIKGRKDILTTRGKLTLFAWVRLGRNGLGE